MPFLTNSVSPGKIFWISLLCLICWLPSQDEPVCQLPISQDMSQSLLLIINQVWHDVKIAKCWHIFQNKARKNNSFCNTAFVKKRVICYIFFPEEARVNPVPAVNFYWIVCFSVKGQDSLSFTLLKLPTKCSEGFPLIKEGNLGHNVLFGMYSTVCTGSVIVLLDTEHISSYQTPSKTGKARKIIV